MATIFTLFTSKRFIFYETQFQKALTIIEQRRSDEIDLWETKQHILLPNVVYRKLSESRTEKTILEKRKIEAVFSEEESNWDVESIHCCDIPMLPVHIKRILCRDDCEIVPMRNNQLGLWREIDSLENLWEVEHDPASPSPQVSPEVVVCTEDDDEVAKDDDVTKSPQFVMPDSTRTAVLEPPPVKKGKEARKETFEAILANFTNIILTLLTTLKLVSILQTLFPTA